MTALRTDIEPWGITRMRPFPDTAVLSGARPVLDAETQTTVWMDTAGMPLPTMDKHKRSETSKETSPKTSLDGTTDQGSDQQGDTD
ncbi:putative ATP-grasp-modified RiPP [Streptomyces eurythermus]